MRVELTANSWIGLILNVAGTVCALAALIQIGRDNQILERSALIHRVSQRWLSGWTWVRLRIFRKSVRVHVGVATSWGVASGVGSASGHASVVPAEGTPIDRRLEMLREEVRELRASLNQESADRVRDRSLLEASIDGQNRSINERLDVMQQQAETVAVRTIPLQAVGLSLVALGTLLSAID